MTWEWTNNSGIPHPMHIRNVQFQVVQRTPPSSLTGYNTVKQGFVDSGWKDTVRASVGMITQMVAKFDVPPGSQPGMSGGYEYVHHCHILEHEENEMMRPFSVKP